MNGRMGMCTTSSNGRKYAVKTLAYGKNIVSVTIIVAHTNFWEAFETVARGLGSQRNDEA